MAIIPIFIHVRKKSDKELREEMEIDRRWRRMMDAEREERERQKRIQKVRKMVERRDREKKMNEEYEKARDKNPWDYQFLPEGWDLLGQRYIPIITEYIPSGYDD